MHWYLVKRKDEVEEWEYSTGADFVEDFADSGNGELAKDAAQGRGPLSL